MDKPRIHVFCPDSEKHLGGVTWLYRHVDVLTASGFDAVIVHRKEGFRPQWLPNETPVTYEPARIHKERDIAVFPEVWAPRINDYGKAIRKVIFAQNAYYFCGPTPLLDMTPLPYASPLCMGAIVMCQDSQAYLERVYPSLRVHRIWCSVDQELYYPFSKTKQICLRPRKNAEDARQVLRILHDTGALRDWKVILPDPADEGSQGKAVRESMIYLNFDHPEGFAQGLAEAMRSGCVAIGYDGRGGRELMDDAFSYPVAYGDVLGFAAQVEAVMREYEMNPERLQQIGRQAAVFIARNYNQDREKESIVNCWLEILGNAA